MSEFEEEGGYDVLIIPWVHELLGVERNKRVTGERGNEVGLFFVLVSMPSYISDSRLNGYEAAFCGATAGIVSR